MTTDQNDFDRFMTLREVAARAYVRGEPGRLDQITSRAASTSFFAPTGGSVVGSQEVASRYRRDAKLFGSDGTTKFEIFDAAASDDLAYWTGIQHAEVQMGGGAPSVMDLRVTEVFRREEGGWKLLHRHADPLVNPQSGKTAT